MGERCKSSTADSQSADLGAIPGAGAIFIRPIVQKENGRPTPRQTEERYLVRRPSSFLRSSKAEQSADNR